MYSYIIILFKNDDIQILNYKNNTILYIYGELIYLIYFNIFYWNILIYRIKLKYKNNLCNNNIG